jgi:hypothetical protein
LLGPLGLGHQNLNWWCKRADLTQGDDIPPARPRARGSRFARGASLRSGLVMAVGAIFLVVILSMLLAYAGRREIARQALVGWLEERGVRAEVQFDRFDFNGLVATISAGDPASPDLVVERAEVDYRLGMPWSGGLRVSPTRIRLIRPRVHATLAEGELSFGALDPIIEELGRRPPSPDQASPTIEVEDGEVHLTTPGGTLMARASALMVDNRLIRLDASLPAARLGDGDFVLDLHRAGLAVRTQGGRSSLALVSDINAIEAAGLRGTAGRVRLSAEIPYPETERRRVHGPVEARLRSRFGAVAWQGGASRGLEADMSFDGQGTGWAEAFALLGGLTGRVTAEQITAGDTQVSRAALVLEGERVRLRRREAVAWAYQGNLRLAAGSVRRVGQSAEAVTVNLSGLDAAGSAEGVRGQGHLGLTAGTLHQDALTLTGVTAAFDLTSRLGDRAATRLEGRLHASGGSWPVLGAVGAADVPEQAALKRALEGFSLDVPALAIQAGFEGTRVSLEQPARLRTLTGGEVIVTADDERPLFAARRDSAGGGALTLQMTGGGLPEARVDVPRYVMADGVIAAAIDGEAALDFGLARGLRLDTGGLLRIGGGRTTFSAASCFPFSAGMLDLGDNDVTDVEASVCPGRGPMLTIADGWRFDADIQDLSANAPFLGMSLSAVSGHVAAGDAGRGLTLTATVADSRIADSQPGPRFHPLGGSGQVSLADDTWGGTIRLREPTQGHRLADLGIRHSGRTGQGGLSIDASGLQFVPEGLQPDQISPLPDGLVNSPVSGSVDFTGTFDWTAHGSTSQGRFFTPGLDFVSPLGAVQQMRGEIRFLSLTPLVTAANQQMTISQVDAFVPLTDVTVDLGLNEASFHIEGTRVAVAGGHVTLEPVDIPFDTTQSWEGVLVLDRVQLGDLFAASSFAESVQLDAVVSGRLPFIYGPNGVTVVAGEVHAVQPGRLSIAREALTGMTAAGGETDEAVPPNTVQDFAYQALEHLWFDDLKAELNSLPGGRLGVLFQIHGRHDPPVEQEIRLGLAELIRRDFLNRVLPLPSGTEINLTLDSSFNLDQLIADLMEIQRARNVSERNP